MRRVGRDQNVLHTADYAHGAHQLAEAWGCSQITLFGEPRRANKPISARPLVTSFLQSGYGGLYLNGRISAMSQSG